MNPRPAMSSKLSTPHGLFPKLSYPRLLKRLCLHFRFSTLWVSGIEAEPTTTTPRRESVGGQAVIEGVMMRSPRRLAVAVRAPDGNIVVDNRAFIPFTHRHWVLSWPILRGAASLIESLAMGLRALNFSIAVQERGAPPVAAAASEALPTASITAPTSATPEATPDITFSQPSSLKDKLVIAASLGMSFLLAMGLFQFLPYFASGQIVGGDKLTNPNPLLFNTVAGMVRMSLLLCYLWAIARLPDVARVFQYHGAEHKSIFAHEHGANFAATPADSDSASISASSDPVEAAARESRFHPRCGTSFILIVALVCIAFFSVFDALYHQLGFSYANFAHRFLVHLPFVPMVAGIAFEVLKLSARFQNSPLVRPLILPGLWLQRITTREPDKRQLDVAIASIRASLA
jgi:uncharacterized protein YqhQ